MSTATTRHKRKLRPRVGRPYVGSLAVLVRIPPDQLTLLDEWIGATNGSDEKHSASRPAAIRHAVSEFLKTAPLPKKARKK